MPEHSPAGRRTVVLERWAGAVVLTAATIGAYGGTFSVPLLYDDELSVANNATIRHFATAFLPAGGGSVAGRPFLNLSLAVNYAVGGTAPWSYHAVNLAIHVLAALVVFGVVRRTPASLDRPAGTSIAFSVALLWSLHPLQTEAVTYLTQRAESLMGLLYLGALYSFIRAVGSKEQPTTRNQRSLWFAASVLACLLGMATKEVMVSAPLIVLLYDRTFVSGTFRGALRRRRLFYSALAATWSVLLFLLFTTPSRYGTFGLTAGEAFRRYALTQLPAIVHYLRLCLWPHPLVFDYGTSLVQPSLGILPWALIVIGLAGSTLWALVRRPAAGFLGACFFAVLAPSSSVIPVATEPMAEHRMYLASIPVITLVVWEVYRRLGRVALPACLSLGACLFVATWKRNEVYLSEEHLWSDTIAKLPDNERAHYNLGNVLSKMPGRREDAVVQYQEAVHLMPGHAEAHYNLGYVLSEMAGRQADAVSQYEEALRLRPDFLEAHFNLGKVFMEMPGRLDDAVIQYEETLRLNPDHAEAHDNLGCALSEIPGRLDDAVAQLRDAIRLKPNYAEAHFNLGGILSQVPGRQDEAVAQYEEALRLKPDFLEAHFNLGNLLLAKPGREHDAAAHFRKALQLRPGFPLGWHNLGVSFFKSGDFSAAAEAFREELRLSPGDPAAQQALAAALRQAEGR
jgi:tetratricopeptide (TPR) repeat protein